MKLQEGGVKTIDPNDAYQNKEEIKILSSNHSK